MCGAALRGEKCMIRGSRGGTNFQYCTRWLRLCPWTLDYQGPLHQSMGGGGAYSDQV